MIRTRSRKRLRNRTITLGNSARSASATASASACVNGRRVVVSSIVGFMSHSLSPTPERLLPRFVTSSTEAADPCRNHIAGWWTKSFQRQSLVDELLSERSLRGSSASESETHSRERRPPEIPPPQNVIARKPEQNSGPPP